jgi:hypothetical protein
MHCVSIHFDPPSEFSAPSAAVCGLRQRQLPAGVTRQADFFIQ